MGGLHEEIHFAIPRPKNIGYFFGGVLHPGDQWVGHDGVGKQLTDGMLQRAGVTGYRRLSLGKSISM